MRVAPGQAVAILLVFWGWGCVAAPLSALWGIHFGGDQGRWENEFRAGPQGVAEATSEGLVVRKGLSLRSRGDVSMLNRAIRESGKFSVEVWVRPSNLRQDGPARVVSLSKNTSLRNFTLGQEGNEWVVRVRTTESSKNGIPEMTSSKGKANLGWNHVVFVREKGGRARLSVNGKRVAERMLPGTLANWEATYPLMLANEATGNRPWQGTIRSVALWNRVLSEEEVLSRFERGGSLSAHERATSPSRTVAAPKEVSQHPNEKHFEEVVAPLLARRCLDCHDAASREGGLDLTQWTAVTKGGKSGPAIMPGKLEASELWHSVESDEMPEDGDPLTAEEKEALRLWIQAGAHWTRDPLDAADYRHGVTPAGQFVRRLTRPEYMETVTAVFGLGLTEEERRWLPEDPRADGFRNTSYNLKVGFQHVEAYARLAESLTQRLDVKAFINRVSRKQSLMDDKGMKRLLQDLGIWVLRGPLSDREIYAYRGITTSVSSFGGEFEEAMQHVLEAMLQSPRFLYRMEEGQALGEYEWISRVSYLVWSDIGDCPIKG
ncbi:MAG: LamG-like jellyroll fold domain-containing protein [Verrucomicrobiota bacterium]